MWKSPSINQSWYLYTFSITPCPTGKSRNRPRANFLILSNGYSSWEPVPIRSKRSFNRDLQLPRPVCSPNACLLFTGATTANRLQGWKNQYRTVSIAHNSKAPVSKNEKRKKNNARSGIPCWNIEKPDNCRHNLLDIKQWEWWCNVAETIRPLDLMLPSRS